METPARRPRFHYQPPTCISWREWLLDSGGQ